jgi:hypothetical protein
LHFTKQVDASAPFFWDYSTYAKKAPFHIPKELRQHVEKNVGLAFVIPQGVAVEQYPVRAEAAHNGKSHDGATDLVLAGAHGETASFSIDDPNVKIALLQRPQDDRTSKFVQTYFREHGHIPPNSEIDAFFLKSRFGLSEDWINKHLLSTELSDIATKIPWRNHNGLRNGAESATPRLPSTDAQKQEILRESGPEVLKWWDEENQKEIRRYTARVNVLANMFKTGKVDKRIVVPIWGATMKEMGTLAYESMDVEQANKDHIFNERLVVLETK